MQIGAPAKAIRTWQGRETIAHDTITEAEFHRLERSIHAFVSLSEDAFLPPSVDAKAGSLSGLTVGVKDIIDVAGLPTRNGSAACADVTPAENDADVVAALRAAGARIVGKTVTTEFAFTDPTDCRNPYDLTRTPGGSSSGSGASVAAGMVDVALGTQTAGSLCRPAAYCGVAGLKPSYGHLSTDGVTPLAPSFDSVGVIARSVGLLRLVFREISGFTRFFSNERMMVARLLFPTEVTPSTEVRAAFDAATAALSDVLPPVANLNTPLDIRAIVEAHRTVMIAEAAQTHGDLLHEGVIDKLQPKFRAALQSGMQVSQTEVQEAREFLAVSASDFWKTTEGFDIVLTLPVPDAAPLLDGTTGFQDWLTPWTVFGGPLVCLPWGLDSLGRPLSVMLAGRPGSDLMLLDVAERLEARAPALPQPKLP